MCQGRGRVQEGGFGMGFGGSTTGQCSQCRGMGGFDVWDKPCREGSSCFKTTCHMCQGRGRVQEGGFGMGFGGSTTGQCSQCRGKGGFDVWDKPCREGSMHFKTTCHMCQGRGRVCGQSQVPFGQQAPFGRGMGG